METFGKKTIYIMWTAVIVFSFFLFSYQFVFKFLTNENILRATIGNSLAIVFFLLIERAEVHFAAVFSKKPPKRKQSAFSHIYRRHLSAVSSKAALYLFYIVLLICSAIVSADPNFPVLGNMESYFKSVEYGFLILIATDTYLGQVFKDTANSETNAQR